MSIPDWDPNLLLVSLIITVGLNVTVFFIAFSFQTDVLTDLTGSVNYIIVALVCLLLNEDMGSRQIGIAICICVARVYLGLFLFYRASSRKGDSRFDGIRENFFQFGTFWVFQIIWVWGTSLPIVYVLARTAGNDETGDIVSFVVFAIGFFFQSVGDIQKFRFKASRQPGIMMSGLWSITRHPNYFGEILMWYSVFAISVIQWYESDDPFWWLIVNGFSPFFTTFILLFFSGMPTAEGSALRRLAERGDLSAWNKYATVTSPLIPVPFCYQVIPDFLKLVCCCEFPMYRYNPEANPRYSSTQA